MKEIACEILAPAGRVDDIQPLLDAGADAIYVGLSGFSARPKMADFTVEQIKQVLPLIRSQGKRLFVAINSNLASEVLTEVYENIQRLDELEVDALIIADYGILAKAANLVSRAELHASTLMGVYNAENVRYLQKKGVSRIILSSDLYLDEITALIEEVPELEYEIVADGGICFNSNRQCLLPHGGTMEDYHVYCQKNYELYQGDTLIGDAYRIGNCPGKIHRTMGIYLGMGVSSFKVEGRTNSLDYILQRVRDMKESKDFYLAHRHEIPGYMHYVRRSYR